jgi:hypothetical protein
MKRYGCFCPEDAPMWITCAQIAVPESRVSFQKAAPICFVSVAPPTEAPEDTRHRVAAALGAWAW